MSERLVSAEIDIVLAAHAVGLPVYATEGSAGADLAAAIDEDAPITLAASGGMAVVPTGLTLALPENLEAQVRPRSGLAARNGVTVLNAPGTIDWDYRGEILVPLINLGPEDFTIRRGDRIAQLVLAPVVRGAFRIAESVGATARGAGGFGSTGAR